MNLCRLHVHIVAVAAMQAGNGITLCDNQPASGPLCSSARVETEIQGLTKDLCLRPEPVSTVVPDG
jgi:hypothetical protein